MFENFNISPLINYLRGNSTNSNMDDNIMTNYNKTESKYKSREFRTQCGLIKAPTPIIASRIIFENIEILNNKKFELNEEIEISFYENQKKNTKMTHYTFIVKRITTIPGSPFIENHIINSDFKSRNVVFY